MPEPVARIHYLDAMRSVLMMLGVVLHAAQVFNPARNWYVAYEPSSAFAGHLAVFVHLFRMPTFFAVSGFFCAMTLQRYGVPGFLRVRLPRIALPLVATALTLNLLQALLLERSGLRPFELGPYLAEGQWITHLWFLLNLFFYFLLAAALAAFAGAAVGRLGTRLAALLASVPWAVLVLALPLAGIAVEALGPLGLPLYAKYAGGAVDVYELLRYLPFFAFGALLYADRALLARLTGASWTILLALTVLAWLALPHLRGLTGQVGRAVIVYTEGLITWSVLALCFRAFHDLFGARSRVWTYLSDASYTVYLFHHVTVMALGVALLDSGLPPLVAMALIIAVTLVATLAVHEFAIRRVAPLRLLFNGKRA